VQKKQEHRRKSYLCRVKEEEKMGSHHSRIQFMVEGKKREKQVTHCRWKKRRVEKKN